MEQDELLQLSDLNLAESCREISRWNSNTDMAERGDMLFVSGADTYASINFAMRIGRRQTSAETFITEAREFFDRRKRSFKIIVRSHSDGDLLEKCKQLRLYHVSRSPGMVLYKPLENRPLPEGVVLQHVTDEESAKDFAEVAARSFASLGQPEEVGLKVYGDLGALLVPHLHLVVAYFNHEPVSCALSLLSNGIAGIYYVGTVETARGRGLAEHCTRAAGEAAFNRGARCVVLQASHMGEPVYRRMGFREFTNYPWFICPS
jgi:ribosomal protein S18 acetylase RimI-like enzyme